MSTTSEGPNVYVDWLGIPPDEVPPDHYTLLRLKRFEDDEKVIEKHHGILSGEVRKYAAGKYGPQSQELLNELSRARLLLTDGDRKRDYDEMLGRVFDDADELGRKPMGRWLIDMRAITTAQLREAEAFAEGRGLSLRDAMVQMKLVKPSLAARALAQELGMSFIDLNETLPDDDALDPLPRSIARRHSVVPLFADDGVILVATADEIDAELDERLRLTYGMPVRCVLATPSAISAAIKKYYAPGMREGKAGKEIQQKREEVAGVTKGKAGGVRFKDLSEAEQKEKRLTGYIILCWGVAGPSLLSAFVLNGLFTNISPWVMPLTTTAVVLPAAVYYVTKVFWR
ncbi:MAG: hypothetical protein AAGJ97_05880 [Planctomycetota bacterium]